MRRLCALLSVCVFVLVAACSENSAKPAPSIPTAATAAAVAATVTPSPTVSPSPTRSLSPTATPSPSPSPTPSPVPSPTPQPTPTQIAEVVAPSAGGCPIEQPVKVTADNQAYNTDHPGYAAVSPKRCYISVDAATKAGATVAALTPTPIAKSAAPISGGCPVDWPVKLTGDKQVYGTDHPSYAAAVPTICYISTDAATKDGYKLAALPTQPPPPQPTAAVPTQAPPPAASAPAAAPVQAPAQAGGPTAQCRDGTFSYSAHRSGTCSHHGGVARWINPPPN